jgi:hypothetical protein
MLRYLVMRVCILGREEESMKLLEVIANAFDIDYSEDDFTHVCICPNSLNYILKYV